MIVHPDAARASSESFVRLQISYEEALMLLSEKRSGRMQMSLLDDRVEVLKNLYRYALKFNGSETEQIFPVLLQQTKSYRPEVYKTLKEYETVFRGTYATWRNRVEIYDAHHDWIGAIVELARFLSDGWSGYRKLMERYLADVKEKAALIDERQQQVLLNLSKWLAEEADGPRAELIYE
jgi:hypothetical protein